MIQALLFDPAEGRQTGGDQTLLDTWRERRDTIVWLDLSEVAKDEESELMQQYFGLHPLAIQDAQRERHPPKVEDPEAQH